MPEEQKKKLQQEIIKRYEELPEELKRALSSISSAETVYAIGKKFSLNVEKTGGLADVIGYTILGIMPVVDLVNNLKGALDIDNAKASEIAREVNTKIFLAIRERLKETHGEGWDERALQQPTTYDRQPTTPPKTQPTTNNLQPITPTTPKSPWEIRPDGLGKPHEQTRTVVPPAHEQTQTASTTKAAEAELKQPTTPTPPMAGRSSDRSVGADNRQPTTPTETPKTREAPQPTSGARRPEVLKEIRPVGDHEQTRTADAKQPITNNQQLITKASPTPKPETPKAEPPTGLPFMKEVSKLTQTPELPQGQSATPTLPTEHREAGAPTKTSEPTTKTPTAPQTQAPTPQKPTQPPSAPPQKYSTDPYREPID